MCLYTKLVKNRKYVANKKNGGNVPPLPLTKDGQTDYRVMHVPRKCGKCIECVKAKRRDWIVRLQIEHEQPNEKVHFVTLTFNTESLKELSTGTRLTGYNLDNHIATLAIRRFTERWRKKYGKTIKHWAINELGNGRWEHMHIHAILWTNHEEDIEPIWQYGFIKKGKYVNKKTFNYITKYITKEDKNHKYFMPKILASKGMGKGYIKDGKHKVNKYKEGETDEGFRTNSGHKIILPTYLRNHIYSEEEREKMWQEKLDNGQRYVMGKAVNENNREDYHKCIKEARRINNSMGYGNDEKNWDEKKYENEQRHLKLTERLNSSAEATKSLDGISLVEMGQSGKELISGDAPTIASTEKKMDWDDAF